VEYCPFHTHAPFPGAVVAVSAPAPPERPTVAANPLPVPVATTGFFPAGAVAAPAPSAQVAPMPPGAQDAPAPPSQGFWGRFFRRGEGDASTNPAPAPSEEPAQTPAR
jgi:hypothetical protein